LKENEEEERKKKKKKDQMKKEEEERTEYEPCACFEPTRTTRTAGHRSTST
jgi:hypothetical protein